MTERMIDSEATTAGRIAQTVGERCPYGCGAPWKEFWGGADRYLCGSWKAPNGHSNDSEQCARRRLAHAQERERTALAREAAWSTAWDEMRDAVLNEHGPLAEMGLTNEQINAVLAVIDDAYPVFVGTELRGASVNAT